MSSHQLTPFQSEVLHAFFRREQGFFLTGGAALVGYYLHHRETTDLDLFCTDAEVYARGRHALLGAASDLGAAASTLQDSPDFKRFAITRDESLVVVDLVHDRVPQLHVDKSERDGVRMDPIEEIVANKLTTLVSRMEERDLVDLFVLERAGFRIESFLGDALAKDGGCTPATLAWLLSELKIPANAKLPGDVAPGELRSWIDDLVARLRRAALPA